MPYGVVILSFSFISAHAGSTHKHTISNFELFDSRETNQFRKCVLARLDIWAPISPIQLLRIIMSVWWIHWIKSDTDFFWVWEIYIHIQCFDCYCYYTNTHHNDINRIYIKVLYQGNSYNEIIPTRKLIYYTTYNNKVGNLIG